MKYRDFLDKFEVLNRKFSVFEKENITLKKENDTLKKENSHLKELLAKYQNPKNSQNSSMPPRMKTILSRIRVCENLLGKSWAVKKDAKAKRWK